MGLIPMKLQRILYNVPLCSFVDVVLETYKVQQSKFGQDWKSWLSGCIFRAATYLS